MIKTYAIKVMFDGTYKEYCYKSFEKLEVGDFVVVQARDSIALAKVTAIDCEDSNATKFVICKINFDSVDKLIKKYNEQKAIEEKIEKRYREVSKMNLYKKLAESDEEIRELVKELESIN